MSVKKRTEKLSLRIASLMSEFSKSKAHTARVSDAASVLDSRYATEVLAAAWSYSLSESSSTRSIRPALKLGLIEISRVPTGTSRSSKDLARLVRAAADEHERRLNALGEAFVHGSVGNAVEFVVAGEWLQSSPFANALFTSYTDALTFLAAKAAGEPFALHPIVDVNEWAARIDRSPGSAELWRDLFLRAVLLVTVARQYPSSASDLYRACILPRNIYTQSFFEGFFTGSMIFSEGEIRNLLCYTSASGDNDVDLVSRPVFDVGDGYVTSSALLLDSIAPRILQWVFNNGGWQEVVTRPFESSVIELVRRAGFQAGPVLDSGSWHPGDGAGDIGRSLQAQGSKCPGEIDVLATDGHELMLLECKSLYPFANPRNAVGRVSDGAINRWITNSERKVEWLESATGLRVRLAAIVVEGVRFIAPGTLGNRVAVLDKQSLAQILA